MFLGFLKIIPYTSSNTAYRKQSFILMHCAHSSSDGYAMYCSDDTGSNNAFLLNEALWKAIILITSTIEQWTNVVVIWSAFFCFTNQVFSTTQLSSFWQSIQDTANSLSWVRLKASWYLETFGLENMKSSQIYNDDVACCSTCYLFYGRDHLLSFIPISVCGF